MRNEMISGRGIGRVRSLPLLVAAASVIGTSAHAATLYWDGTNNGNTGTGFNSVTSWSTASGATTPDPAAIPGASDVAVFNISTVNSAQVANLTGNVSVGGLVFNNTGTTNISQNGSNRTFNLGASGIVANVGAGAATLGVSSSSLGLTLAASQTWTNDSSGLLTVRNAMNNGAGLTDTLTLAGSGSGGFAFSNVINEGAGSSLSIVIDTTGGTTTLTSSGTYTGGVTVKQGVVSANNGASFGTGNVLLGDTSGAGNASVTMGTGTFANNITVQAGSSGTVTLRNAGNTPVLSGTLTLNKATIFDIGSGNTTAITSTVAGSGNITLNNSGTLQLGTGGTSGALATGTTVSGTGILGFNRSDNVALNANTSGGLGLSQSGTGTLTLTGVTGAIHAATGATKVNDGTLKLDFTNAASADNLIVSTSALTLGATRGGTLTVVGKDSTANTQTFASTTLTAGFDNNVNVTSGSGGTTALTLGAITRNLGSFVNFSTDAGSTITTSAGSANTILVSSSGWVIGAYGSDWAARGAAGNNVVAASTIGGFYTATTAGTITGHADVASGVDSVLAGDATASSLRFNVNEARTVDLGASTLTLSTGGLMIGNTVATAGSKIIGGTLKGSNGSGRELVVVQNSAQPFEIASAIADSTGATALSKHGSGTLILSGTNSSTGQTYLAGGTLQVGTGGTTGNLSAAGITNHGVLIFNRSDAMTVSGAIGGTGSVQQIGAGATTFSVGSTYVGGLAVKRGTAIAMAAGAFGANTGTVTLGDLAGGSNDASLLVGTSAITIGNPIVLSSATSGTLTIGNTSPAVTSGTFSGIISGDKGLVVKATGTGSRITFTGVNTYTGGLTVKSGDAYSSSNASAFGTGTITLGDTSGSADASVVLGNASPPAAYSNPINVVAGSSGTLTIGSDATSGSTGFSGAITLANDLTIRKGSNTAFTISGGITGTGDVTLRNDYTAASFIVGTGLVNHDGAIANVGSGTAGVTISAPIGANVDSITQNSATSTLIISGTNTSFAGPVSILAGTLRAGATAALSVNNTVSVNSGAIFEVMPASAQTLTIAGLNGAGNVNLVTGATRTLAMGGAGTYSHSGAISNASSTFNVIKSGLGSQTLAGALSYTGTTVINGGLLSITGTQTGAGAYTINSGGTLGGSGSITTAANANVTLASGGKIAPGTSPGTLTFDLGTGTLSLVAGVTPANSQALLFELATPATSDQVKITNSASTLAIGSGVLNWDDFVFSNAGLINGTFVLFDSGKAISGSLGASKTGSLGGIFTGELSISEDGQDIILTVVPEPATLSLLGLGAMGLLRRRRQIA